MSRHTSLSLVAGLIAALLSHSPCLAGKRPGGGGTASRTISVEWRKDSFVPPEIRTLAEDGSGLTTVNGSPDLGRGGWPRWSPNGQRIGCYRKTISDNRDNYLDDGYAAMNATGGNEQWLITSSEFNAWNLARTGVISSSLNTFYTFACWLGNDALVVCADTDYAPEFFGESDPSWCNGGSRLFIVDADAIYPLTEAKVQNAGFWTDLDPHWSPVQNQIVFISDRTGVPELFAINPDGTGLVQISDFWGDNIPISDIYGPVWDPTGTRVAVSLRNDATGVHIWIAGVDTTQATPGLGGRLTSFTKFQPQGTAGTTEDTAAWSPTGDRLIFARFIPGTGAGGRSGRAFQIVIANVQTGTERVIINSTKQAVLFPDWNPVP